MWRGLLLILTVAPVAAQISQMTATDDGSVVYFASKQNGESRIYKVDALGVQLFAERDASQVADCDASRDGGVDSPRVSGDGSIVGYTVRCTALPEAAMLYRDGAVQQIGAGTLSLSRNGRWALVRSHTDNPYGYADGTLIDLGSGDNTVVQDVKSGNNLASDGTVLTARSLWRADGEVLFTSLNLQDRSPFGITDDGAKLLLSGLYCCWNAYTSIMDLTNGTVRTIAYSVFGFASRVVDTSNDGGWALVFSLGPGGIWTASIRDTRTGELWPLDLPGESAVAGAISGSGNVAFVATESGRLLKIELNNGVPGALTDLLNGY